MVCSPEGRAGCGQLHSLKMEEEEVGDRRHGEVNRVWNSGLGLMTPV